MNKLKELNEIFQQADSLDLNNLQQLYHELNNIFQRFLEIYYEKLKPILRNLVEVYKALLSFIELKGIDSSIIQEELIRMDAYEGFMSAVIHGPIADNEEMPLSSILLEINFTIEIIEYEFPEAKRFCRGIRQILERLPMEDRIRVRLKDILN